MDNNIEIRKGLNLIYIATILDIVSSFLSRSVIAVLVCAAVMLVLYFMATLKIKDSDENYERAFVFLIIYTVLDLLNYLFIARLTDSMLVSLSVTFVLTVVFALFVFHIIRGTNFLLQKNGYDELVKKGNKAWKLYLVFNVIYLLIVSFVSLPSYWAAFIFDYLFYNDRGMDFLLILTLLGILAGIAAKAFYAVYLNKAKEKV